MRDARFATGRPMASLNGIPTLQSGPDRSYLGGMNEYSAIPLFALSERAAARIAEITTEPGQALRVTVLAGGCSGFQYRFDLDANRQPDDVVISLHGASVVVDQASLELLAGAELDFTDALMGSYFTVRNPNATSSCGCGTSFAID